MLLCWRRRCSYYITASWFLLFAQALKAVHVLRSRIRVHCRIRYGPRGELWCLNKRPRPSTDCIVCVWDASHSLMLDRGRCELSFIILPHSAIQTYSNSSWCQTWILPAVFWQAKWTWTQSQRALRGHAGTTCLPRLWALCGSRVDLVQRPAGKIAQWAKARQGLLVWTNPSIAKSQELHSSGIWPCG